MVGGVLGAVGQLAPKLAVERLWFDRDSATILCLRMEERTARERLRMRRLTATSHVKVSGQ